LSHEVPDYYGKHSGHRRKDRNSRTPVFSGFAAKRFNFLSEQGEIDMGLVECALEYLAVHILRLKGDSKKVFLFHSTINNFAFMVLPLAISFLPQAGAGLLFIQNLGYTILLLTLGMSLLYGKTDKESLRVSLLSPALIATVLSTILVLTGLNRFIPKMVLMYLNYSACLQSPCLS
jgi:predicted permease